MRPAPERGGGRGQPAAVQPGEAGLLANRDFRLYFAARVVSQLGDQLYVFAISWFVLDLTRSSFHMAALLALLFLQRGGWLSIGALYGGTVLLGLCSAVFLPAATAIVPGLVGSRRIPEAVAAGQASANFCPILGMLLGGALYRFIGIGGVLLLNAASNLAAAAMVSRLRAGRGEEAGAAGEAAGARRETAGGTGELRRFAAELWEGLARVRADRVTFSLLLVNTAFTLAVMPIAWCTSPTCSTWSSGPRSCRKRFRRRPPGRESLPAPRRPRGSWAAGRRRSSSPEGCWGSSG